MSKKRYFLITATYKEDSMRKFVTYGATYNHFPSAVDIVRDIKSQIPKAKDAMPFAPSEISFKDMQEWQKGLKKEKKKPTILTK